MSVMMEEETKRWKAKRKSAYERQLKELQEAYGEAILELRSGKNLSSGFTPDFTDTYKKADTGHEECSCQSVASSVPSSSVVQWNKQVGQVSAAPR